MRDLRNIPYLTILLSSWFALGLLAVLLLALLLAASLTFLGPWLEENWSITFPTPLPLVWWYVFPLIPLLLILLYFLKLKRRAMHVPSTFLWKKSIEDLHVNSFFQWLRRNLLLILQLLFLVGLGYALADPTYNSEARGRHIILMIDNSASMSSTDAGEAQDQGRTRLEEAKRRAHRLVDQLDPSDQAMVIAFNDEARTVQSYTNNKRDLHAAIEGIGPTHRRTDLEAALALAEGQANPVRSGVDFTLPQADDGMTAFRATERPEGLATQVHIFTDGRFRELPDFRLGNIRPRLEVVGSSADNVGIVRLGLTRSEEEPDQFQLTLQVANFGDEPIRDRLAVRLEVFNRLGRQDVRIEPFNLAPRQVRETTVGTEGKVRREETPGLATPQPFLVFTFKDPGQGHVRVSLLDRKTGRAWEDVFSVDDTAWLAITPIRRARILRIGTANDILDAALRAVVRQQRAVVTSLEPSAIPSDPVYRLSTQTEQFDLVIFDRCAPPSMETMPYANTLFIGQVPPLPPLGNELWSKMQPMEDLYVKEFLISHPLMRGIETLQGMSINQGRALPPDVLPPRSSALIETQKEPVLWALGRGRYTDLVMTFPLVVEEQGVKNIWNTNWPRQPAGTFPLFFDNVVLQLGRYKEYEDSTRPGEPKALELEVPVRSVEVRRLDPAGDAAVEIQSIPGRELAFGDTDYVGLYEASWAAGQTYLFAVNLFDSQESMIEPRRELQIGEEVVSGEEQPMRRRRELWPWFVLAALVVLVIEWIVYQRRIYV